MHCCCTEKPRLWEAAYEARWEKATTAYTIFVGEPLAKWKFRVLRTNKIQLSNAGLSIESVPEFQYWKSRLHP
jgi:hypothetical protein